MATAASSRRWRLRSRREFQRVFAARRAVSGPFFRIHWAPTPESRRDGARLGLAIAKRVARRAVDRNRLRRLARESFRHRRTHLRDADFVVLARPGAAAADNAALRRALDQLWLKLESR